MPWHKRTVAGPGPLLFCRRFAHNSWLTARKLPVSNASELSVSSRRCAGVKFPHCLLELEWKQIQFFPWGLANSWLSALPLLPAASLPSSPSPSSCSTWHLWTPLHSANSSLEDIPCALWSAPRSGYTGGTRITTGWLKLLQSKASGPLDTSQRGQSGAVIMLFKALVHYVECSRTIRDNSLKLCHLSAEGRRWLTTNACEPSKISFWEVIFPTGETALSRRRSHCKAPACCENSWSFTDLAKLRIRHDLQTKERPKKDNQPAGFIF